MFFPNFDDFSTLRVHQWWLYKSTHWFNGGNGIPGWLSALVVLQKFDNFWPQAVVDHCRIEAVIQTGDPNAIPLCSGRLDRYWSSIPQSIWVGWWRCFSYIFLECSPRKLGEENEPILTVRHIFQMGWFHSTQPPGMLTLFMSITGGLSWIDALEALTSFSFFALTFFVIYIVPWLTITGNHRDTGCRW